MKGKWTEIYSIKDRWGFTWKPFRFYGRLVWLFFRYAEVNTHTEAKD